MMATADSPFSSMLDRYAPLVALADANDSPIIILASNGEELYANAAYRSINVPHDQQRSIVFENDEIKVARVFLPKDPARIAAEIMLEIAENLPIMVWLRDFETNEVLFINRAYEKIWGRSRESLYKEPDSFIDAILPEDRRYLDQVRKKHGEGVPTSARYRIRRPDGDIRWISARSAPVFDADGKQYRRAGIAEDVTEQTLLQSRTADIQRLESLGRLAGGVAHDFNNLLTAVIGYVEMALEKLPKEADARAYLENVLTASDRATALIKQMLAYARRQPIRYESIDLNETIRRAEPLLRGALGKNIELNANLHPSLQNIRADESQIQQVLLNLASNSRDAMPNGGRVTIETKPFEVASTTLIGFHELRPGSYALLTFSDNGPGMSQDNLRRATEPFFTTKESGIGTGLGLSTCEGILLQSGGAMDIEAEPGQGARVLTYWKSYQESID